VASLRVIPSPDFNARLTPHGTIIRVRKGSKFRHPFRVVASGKMAIVSEGILNDLVPTILENGKKRRIDNRDSSGVLEKASSAPRLKLDLSKASKDGRIYISIRYTLEAGDKPAEAEIVQTDSAKGPVDGRGYYPLAMLFLTEDRKSIERTFQITHHNLRVTFQERTPSAEDLEKSPGAKPIGRYIFYPA
jgi:hypothetical protein